MKDYGDYNLISNNLNKIVEEIKGYLSLNNIQFSCYYSYPVPIEEGEPIVLPCLIVSKLGIFNFCESEKDILEFSKACMRYIFSFDSLNKKVFQGVSVFVNIELNKYKGVSFIDERKDVLTQEEIDYFESKIQGASTIQQRDDRDVKKELSVGSLIKKRSQQINKFSINQSNYINNSYLDLCYRIRGLAGSGKTIVMVKRMAYLHFKDPDLKLAYVFYTVSLKQYILNLFMEFYKGYTSREPNMENLYFLHGWGSKTNAGFYSRFCAEVGIECEPFDPHDYRRSSFDLVCSRALANYNLGRRSLYDYVFIDEAQDFPKTFFDITRLCLKPTGGFSYAYDELQTLSYSVMPKKSEIVGDLDCRDVNLDVCYRTPKEILVTAHALGMAIYCDNPNVTKPINVPEDIGIWKATGYKSIPKTISLGKDISFYRENPYTESFTPSDPVVIMSFQSEEEQYKKAYEEICNLLHKEDVETGDLLIIDLKPGDFEMGFSSFRRYCYERLNKGKPTNGERLFDLHIVNQNDRLKFRRNNSIPYTSVFRAKGNESNIVFIFNAQSLSSLMSHSRNKLFTAMTRAKFKVYVFGLNEVEEIKKESEIVAQKDFKLEFRYPTRDELKNLMKIAAAEEEEAADIVKGGDLLVKLNKDDSTSSLYEALKLAFGEEKAKKMIKAMDDNEEQ